MEISSISSQALALKENMTQVQLGTAVLKQAADAQNRLAEVIAQRAKAVSPPDNSQQGRLDTYA